MFRIGKLHIKMSCSQITGWGFYLRVFFFWFLFWFNNKVHKHFCGSKG